MFNFQSEIELMKLRAESHEERYKKIDKETEDLLEKKTKWSENGSDKETLERRMR